jgi:putative ABC transport system ATP-binding protein
MLTMRELSKVYRTDTVQTTALDAIDLDIAEGEFVAIMGPSGCGKSTLLNMIGMLDSPSSGSYVFNGKEVAGLSEASSPMCARRASASSSRASTWSTN